MSHTIAKKEIMNRSNTAMTLNIGKSRINDNIIEEIKRQLKEKELVKIRFAKNISSEKDEYINQIIKNTNATLVDIRGNVAILFKKQM